MRQDDDRVDGRNEAHKPDQKSCLDANTDISLTVTPYSTDDIDIILKQHEVSKERFQCTRLF